ncbi:MAG: mechanosensitive ion channel [Bacteroidales bacterium]|nr:mechanosensitive ion channel [Bacteroidales bacterium]
MLKQIHSFLFEWLKGKGVSESNAQILTDYSTFIILIAGSVVAYYITKIIIVRIVNEITKKSPTKWDDALRDNKFFSRLAYFLPAYLIFILTPQILVDYPKSSGLIQNLCIIYMIFVMLMVVSSFLNAIADIYQDFSISRKKPIKGYLQIAKIIIYLIGAIVIIAHLFGKNPLGLLGGLGAFSAVLLLIFKDPILGFVGGLQLSANNMLQPGDWITMPKYDADGTVIDIALTTVKVQNWDKTISTIPTYSLIESSFKNWRGMEESGGRRIKRSIFLDMKSVRFCNEEMLAKFKKIEYVKEYVEEKEKELNQYNKERNIDDSVLVNGRRQTNLGVFRAYLRGYLLNHPLVHHEMTFLVRQLEPSEKGIPMEIYVFSKVQEWAKYEDLQSDIFDHILAVIPEFGLLVFQNPGGSDFRKLIN